MWAEFEEFKAGRSELFVSREINICLRNGRWIYWRADPLTASNESLCPLELQNYQQSSRTLFLSSLYHFSCTISLCLWSWMQTVKNNTFRLHRINLVRWHRKIIYVKDVKVWKETGKLLRKKKGRQRFEPGTSLTSL